jgi:hypothetical protein
VALGRHPLVCLGSENSTPQSLRATMEGETMNKTFDWDECSKQHRPAHVAWLKANHGKPIEEAAYIAALRDCEAQGIVPQIA